MAMPGYDWKGVEPNWQQWWLDDKIFEFDQSHDAVGLPYLVDNPPRYASGALHVGHAVHYAHIDMAARYKRMAGYNVMFPLCFDTNGIPIEERVERMLGVTRLDIDRHDFIDKCREFASQNIEDMTHQFTILGCSMDPSVYYQTDAPYYRRVTQISFLEMFKRDLVYKGTYPVNWCPRCLTALADAEVEYRDRDSKFNDVPFIVEETGEEVVISTTRPELLCTCQMVAIHPSDPRKDHLVGKHMITPIYKKRVPIVEDDAVDPEKGTGIVMICSIGDKEDMEWIRKHHLRFDMAIDDEGRMTEVAGKYVGMKTDEAKEAIIRDLDEAGLLRDQSPTLQSVGSCWRCHTAIEFLVKPQWFLKSMPYKYHVHERADELNWYPEHMRQRLDDWVNSLEWDWVISRQRYFATPIPLWECEGCDEVIPATEEMCYVDPTIDMPPVNECPKCGGHLRGCEDVFDTWMDSSISPVYIAFWKRDEEKFRRFFPTGLRPQAHDIIRTWAYYSLLRSHLLFENRPWNDIMIDGFILSTDGTPMHASLGNAIDPVETLEEYGGDVMRYLSSLCALGQDNNFKPQDLVRGRRFVLKFWNVQQFIGSALERAPAEGTDAPPTSPIDKWILHLLAELVERARDAYDGFDFAPVMRDVEFFIWHELADHYIELVKSRVYAGDDPAVFGVLRTLGIATTKLLAPILPMVTEEVYQKLYKELDGAVSVHISKFPEPPTTEPEAVPAGEFAKTVAAAVRNWKSDQGIPLNAPLASVQLITSKADLEDISRDLGAAIVTEELTFAAEDPTLKEEPKALKPVHARIGPEFRQQAKEILGHIASADPAEVASALRQGGWTVQLSGGEAVTLTDEYLSVESGWFSHGHEVETITVDDIVVVMSRK
jgi:valyl-tRNA synthetase